MKKLKNKIAFVLLFILVSAMSQAKGLDHVSDTPFTPEHRDIERAGDSR